MKVVNNNTVDLKESKEFK